MSVVGIEGKLVYIKWILVYFFVVVEIVSSVNDVILEIEVN